MRERLVALLVSLLLSNICYKHFLKQNPFIQQEETKARIQSVLEHLCGEDCKLEIYQKDNTDEVMVYGDSIDGLYCLLAIYLLVLYNYKIFHKHTINPMESPNINELTLIQNQFN